MDVNTNAVKQRSFIGPLILIGIGTLFLVHNLVGFDLFRIIRNYWPVLLIIIGLAKLAEYYKVSRQIPR